MQSTARELVTAVESATVDWDSIRRMLGPELAHTRLVLYDDLRDVRSMDALFGRKRNVVLWMNIKGSPAGASGHWVGLLRFPSHVEHFDSYGLTADAELAITHERAYLTSLIAHAQVPVRESTAQLQSRRNHVNTCGRWVVARILQRARTLQAFTAFYSGFGLPPDVIVSLVTLLL